jgi:homoserine acetyltransferase
VSGPAQIFQAGDVVLQSGRVFPRMVVSYKTFGTLDATRSNVIVYPTSYSARHADIEFMVAEGGALDPACRARPRTRRLSRTAAIPTSPISTR